MKNQQVTEAPIEDVVNLRHVRDISDREIAMTLVLELAVSSLPSFSLLGFYDDDAEFISDLADKLKTKDDRQFKNKLTKVVRVLVNYGILYSRMGRTEKEYIGEPAKQKDYWLRPGKASLLTRGKTDYTMSPDDEASFLVRRAYPTP